MEFTKEWWDEMESKVLKQELEPDRRDPETKWQKVEVGLLYALFPKGTWTEEYKAFEAEAERRGLFALDLDKKAPFRLILAKRYLTVPPDKGGDAFD